MRKPKIFLSGGGTLGSVMPLLALWEELRKDYDCYWVGSRKGVEKDFVLGKGIKYYSIVSGKWRKYLSIKNLLTPLFVFFGLKGSLWFLVISRPKVVVVSGSFVSVPLVWASWILRVPVIVHQEDIDVGLAGKLTIPFATAVTVAFEKTLNIIKHKNKFLVGNPVRSIFYSVDKKEAEKKWKTSLPLVLVLGGGLGSEKINQAMIDVARKNNNLEIVDITGKNKTTIVDIKNYKQIEQLGDELAEVMSSADIVVSRAGLSTLSELGALGKPVILVPLKQAGQSNNAEYLVRRDATVVISEEKLKDLEKCIVDLIKNKNKQEDMAKNIKKIFPSDSIQRFLQVIKKTA